MKIRFFIFQQGLAVCLGILTSGLFHNSYGVNAYQLYPAWSLQGIKSPPTSSTSTSWPPHLGSGGDRLRKRRSLCDAAEATKLQCCADNVKDLSDLGSGLPTGEATYADRRGFISSGLMAAPILASHLLASPAEAATQEFEHGPLKVVTDPSTYSALAYSPPGAPKGKKIPLIVVLHGAGINKLDVWNLANPKGEHAGLAPSLLSSGSAPPELASNFAVLAPYSANKRSFYEEPRKALLQFVEWACSEQGREAGCPDVDPSRVFLFGFSDGATCGVELMTTGRFAGGVFAAYGFTGKLPEKAVARLKGKPMWIFHSADDVIFPVSCSDRLVKTLQAADSTPDLVKYTRFDEDQEGFTGDVRGHSTGITASKTPDVYTWLLNIKPKS